MRKLKKHFRSLIASSAFAAATALMPTGIYAQNNKIPARPTDTTETFQTHDLTSLPCAGKEATLYMSAKDALGQEGKSQQKKIVLPSREFKNPANPLLAEQRCALSLDARKAGGVALAIDAIIQGNAKNMPEKKTVERLRTVRNTIATSRDENVLEQSLEDLWSIMQQLEEDILSPAERKLLEAERALREALERNATEEELRQKSEELAKAMEEALAERAEKANDPKTKQDLEEMKKLMEELRKLQEELGKSMTPEMMQKMMKQMQEGSKSAKGQQNQSSMKDMLEQMKKQIEQMQQMKHLQEQMKELEKLMKEQKELRDDTEKDSQKRALDMDAIRQKLEELTKNIDQEIEKEKQQELQKIAPPAQESPFKKTFFRNAAEPAAPLEKKGRLKQLDNMDKTVDGVADQLGKSRQENRKLNEGEAQEMTDTLGQIQQELNRNQKKDEGQRKSPPQGSQGNQKQNPSDLLEQLKQMLQKKQKEQRQQDGKDNRNGGQKQQDLQSRLEKMINEMKQKGMNPGKLDDAGKSMDNAKDSLNQNSPSEAVPSQDKALEAMQEAMEQLQQQMQQMMGDGNGPGSSPPSVMGSQKDFLGTKGGNSPNTGIKPDTLQQDNLTKDIRDQIRKRLEDPKLPKREREYLERLNNQGRNPSP